MPKRQETLAVEEGLANHCMRHALYGCEEVTIGFANHTNEYGHGDEIVDFVTMDSHGIIRCYEIKVSMSDLRSDAKKSWYGHYNYLAVSPELYEKIKDRYDELLPPGIGIICGTENGITVTKRATRQDIPTGQAAMLKESMIRSMYYKMNKYKGLANYETKKSLREKAKRWQSKCEKTERILDKLQQQIRRFERARLKNTGEDREFGDIVKKELKRAGMNL